jgi:hypothetical protein
MKLLKFKSKPLIQAHMASSLLSIEVRVDFGASMILQEKTEQKLADRWIL